MNYLFFLSRRCIDNYTSDHIVTKKIINAFKKKNSRQTIHFLLVDAQPYQRDRQYIITKKDYTLKNNIFQFFLLFYLNVFHGYKIVTI